MKKLLLLLMLLPLFGHSQQWLKDKTLTDWRAYTHSFRPDTANLMDLEGVRLTKAYYLMAEQNEMAESIQFGFVGESAIKTRDVGVDNFVEKIYSIHTDSRTGDGVEKIVNGDFTTDTDWTKGTGWTISGGVAVASAVPSGQSIYQNVGINTNTYYKVSITISGYVSGRIKVQAGLGGVGNLITANGTYTQIIESGTNSFFYITADLPSTLNVDNVSVQELSPAFLDGTQTTAANQPYLSGNIAPTERKGIKNPNGDARYITHPEISFGATDAWSVTTCLNYNSSISSYQSVYSGSGLGELRIRDFDTNRFKFVNDDISTVTGISTDFLVGKNTTLTTVANGDGTLLIYSNGILIDELSIATNITLNQIGRYRTGAWYLHSTINAHIIRNIALTPAQVAAEADWLQTVYPEIPTVQIGTQNWQTSNFDAVATPQGNIIANVTEAVNVEKITNGDFADASNWNTTGVTISGGKATYDAVTDFALIDQFNTIPAGWLKISFEVLDNNASSIGIFNASTSVVIKSYTSYNIGTHSFYYKATSNLNGIAFYSRTPRSSFSLDNVSVEEIGWAGSQELYDGLITQGESVQTALEASAMWCYYNNDSQLGATYGKLYNWFAVALLQADIDTYNTANPDNEWGYHVPTQAEFTTLQTYLGGSTVAGGKMKVEGLDYWNTPNTGATNWSGFSALGSGIRFDTGTFGNINNFFYQWGVGAVTSTTSDRFFIGYNVNSMTITPLPNNYGISLRLVKD